MGKAIGIASGILLLVLRGTDARAADTARGSMSIPVSLADLAAAAGTRRSDPSTLPLDIVRLVFAAPDGASDQPADRRAAIRRALERDGTSGDDLPLPLTPAIWRAHVFHAQVADDRIAAAIFGSRATALLYHGLLALDPPTLAWIEANPAVLEVLQKQPGATAAFVRSIHIREGVVVTPGEGANDLWQGLVGAEPREPLTFIARLLSARYGRAAAFYDAMSHLDRAHQRFALGAASDPDRMERARRLMDVATRDASPWRLEEHPFMRPEVDVSQLLRQTTLDARGIPAGPSQRVWARVFGEAMAADAPVDAAWLTAAMLKPGAAPSRRRLEAFLFGQRALAADATADPATLVSALRDFQRYPALMLVLEANGIRAAAAYAAAGRAAAALGHDEDAITLFQSGLAIVDRAHRTNRLRDDESHQLIASLIDAAASRTALLSWFRRLIASLGDGEAEASLLDALAGPAPAPPVNVEWEGSRYSVDLALPERRRLASVRAGQREVPLGEAIASATPRNLSALANSLAGLVYALAIGEADSQASLGGAVWRRHRLGSTVQGPRDSVIAWRLATEVFGAGGWHLTGSLLRLDVALAHLALRRLDPTEMPGPSSLSTMDRRTLARTIALMDARAISDEARDAVAAAIARGRERVATLAAKPEALDAIAADAAVSEWRHSAIQWRLTHGSARVVDAFTTLELFRLGDGAPQPGWGASTDALDGCFCLRLPDAAAWEEYSGRASTGQLGTQLADVMLRTAEALSSRRLPALLLRDVAAFAMQDVMDMARPAYFDDWLSVAFAARDLSNDRFDDYVAALTAAGPLVPVPKIISR